MPRRIPLLSVQNLHVSVGRQEVVRGVTLDIPQGELHVIMGPNGAGKSTLVHALMGHPGCIVTAGRVRFLGKNLLALASHERAQAGLFLAFQHPRDIAGVSLSSFLYTSYNAQMAVRSPKERKFSPIKFREFLLQEMHALRVDPSLLERSVHHGFSGGEKKKAEVLQLRVLRPRLALLDETDSGLDIDALKIVAQGIRGARTPTCSMLVVTHYARLLTFLSPDRVHVMVRGEIVESGGPKLVDRLEREGYGKYGKALSLKP